MAAISHLFRQVNGGFSRWSSGAAEFFTDERSDGFSSRARIRCRLEGLGSDELALLDTAAEWSVIGRKTAELLEVDGAASLDKIRYSTRLGVFEGSLHRVAVSLLAKPGWGQDLVIDATVAVLERWPGPVVLEFQGLLERVRIAFDPGERFGSGVVYFGAATGETE